MPSTLPDISVNLAARRLAINDTLEFPVKLNGMQSDLETWATDLVAWGNAVIALHDNMAGKLDAASGVATGLQYTHYTCSDLAIDFTNGNSQYRDATAIEALSFAGATAGKLAWTVLESVDFDAFPPTEPGALTWITPPVWTAHDETLFFTRDGGINVYGCYIGAIV